MNEGHFKEQYSRLTSVFDAKFLPKTYRGSMFQAVRKLDNRELTAAVDLVIETFLPNSACRFPTPAHILQAARQWTQSNQAVPREVDDDTLRFQEEMAATDRIWDRIRSLPEAEYQRLLETAHRQIEATCPKWLHKLKIVVDNAKRGRAIEIYCRENNIPLPSKTPHDDERDGAQIVDPDFGVGYLQEDTRSPRLPYKDD